MNPGWIAEQIDRLYRDAVEQAHVVDDRFLADWAESAAEGVTDRAVAAAVRRAVRTARKLTRYWSERDSARLPDWRNGVDEALGGLGWQAQLDVLLAGLEAAPDPELFAMVRERHRSVHFTEWMEGVAYEDWVAAR